MLRYARDGYTAARRLVPGVRECAQGATIGSQARAFYLSRLRSLERVAIHNIVAIDVMLKEPGLGGPSIERTIADEGYKALSANFSFTHHPFHPALVISRGSSQVS